MRIPDFQDESELEDFCCAWAFDEYGLTSLKVEKIEKGLPDRQFFMKRVYRLSEPITLFFVEFKDLGEEATSHQRHKHQILLQDSGFRTHVVDSFEKFRSVCREEVRT